MIRQLFIFPVLFPFSARQHGRRISGFPAEHPGEMELRFESENMTQFLDAGTRVFPHKILNLHDLVMHERLARRHIVNFPAETEKRGAAHGSVPAEFPQGRHPGQIPGESASQCGDFRIDVLLSGKRRLQDFP